MTEDKLPDGWMEAFLETVTAFPTTYRGFPALAVTFEPVNPVRMRNDMSETPGILVGSLIAEDPEGRPVCCNMLASVQEGSGASETSVRPVSEAIARQALDWFSGNEPARIASHAHGMPHSDALVHQRPLVPARMREVIARAAGSVGFSTAFHGALSAAAQAPGHAAEWADLLFRDDGAGERARAYVLSYPVYASLEPESVARAAKPDASVPPEPCFMEPTPALHRWLRHPVWAEAVRLGMLTGRESVNQRCAILEVANTVPPAWLPRTVEQLASYMRLTAFLQYVRFDQYARFVVHAGPDWTVFERRCTAVLGVPYEHLAPDYIDDPTKDLFMRLVMPVQADLHAKGEGPSPFCDLQRRQDLDRIRFDAKPDPNDIGAIELLDLTERLLYRDKGLPGILATAKEWHGHLHEIDGAIPTEHDKDPPWTPLFEPVVMGDIRLAPLVTAAEMEAEGGRLPDANGVPGLDHCISSYRPQAAMGFTHIVSLRRDLPDGRYERLATAEIGQDIDGTIHLVQMHGRDNTKPPVEAARAMDEFLAQNSILPFVAPRRPESFEKVRALCGYDWTVRENLERAVAAYAFLLPRDLRSLDALRRHLGDALPPAYVPVSQDALP